MGKKVTVSPDGRKLYGRFADSIPFHAFIGIELDAPLDQLRTKMGWTNNEMASMGLLLLVEKYRTTGIIT